MAYFRVGRFNFGKPRAIYLVPKLRVIARQKSSSGIPAQ